MKQLWKQFIEALQKRLIQLLVGLIIAGGTSFTTFALSVRDMLHDYPLLETKVTLIQDTMDKLNAHPMKVEQDIELLQLQQRHQQSTLEDIKTMQKQQTEDTKLILQYLLNHQDNNDPN